MENDFSINQQEDMKNTFNKSFMKTFIIILFSLIGIGLNAQPGSWGGYNMSFVLIDKSTNSIIDLMDKNYKVFPTCYYGDKYEIIDTFKYDTKKNCFYYQFESTPVGPALRNQFTINVVYKKDTMKIYSAESFKGDTLHFQKGEYISTENYLIAKSISTFNNTKILNKNIYDYELTKLIKLPYYNVEENGQLKIDGLTYSTCKSFILPNNETVVFGEVRERIVDGNVLSNITSGSYSPYTNKTSISDNGLAFSLISKPEEFIINYNYEILDSILGKEKERFSLKDDNLKKYFPKGLNWLDTNSITFALLTDLKLVNDSLWIITINQDKQNKKIFTSKNKGENWEQSFSYSSKTNIGIRAIGMNNLFAFSGNKLFCSYNQAKTWSIVKLQNDSLNVIDLLIKDDTTAFLLNQQNKIELLKLNLKTGECYKLLGNINCCEFDWCLNQRVRSLFTYNHAIVLQIGNSFFKSNDFGATWKIISNDCTRIIKNGKLFTWYKRNELIEMPKINYGYYYPGHHKCDKIYYVKSVVQYNNRLKALCYYNDDRLGSPHVFAEINIVE